MNVRGFLTVTLLLLISVGVQADPVPPSSPPIPNKNVTPTARTCPQMNGIYFTGDFIYWKARQEELVYAGYVDLNFTTTTRDFSIKAVEIDFDYDPGFKLGLGGNLPYDGWDLYLNWTHLHNTTQSSISSASGDIINIESLSGSGGPPFLAHHAKASYRVLFNSLDFDWGRRFYLSETFTVRPSFGIKAAWIHQKLTYDFENMLSIPIPPTDPNGIRVPGNPEIFRATVKSWGVGPYFSINGKWGFGWGFGLYGELSGALLWGRFKQEGFSTENDLESDGQNLILIRSTGKVSYEGHRVRPTVQAFIGLDWERCIIEKWLALNFRIGYETQYFFSQIINMTDEVEESDLSFEGLTFTGRLDF